MSPFDLRITNEVKAIPVPLGFLKTKIKAMLLKLGWKKAGLSLLLVSDSRIRKLNRHYLRHDRPTDVIAFSQLEGGKLKIGKGAPWIGDIVISLPTTKRQAREFGNSFKYELCFYICHGILHIMGYRDKSKKEAAQMAGIQKKILKQIGVKGAGDKDWRHGTRD